MMGLFGVTFRYGGREILKNATLVLPERGVVCLSGPSGCGKTTALHLLAGLLTPNAGEARLPGKIAAVFQEDRLLNWLDAIGNAALPPGVSAARAEALLGELGLDEPRRPVANLSGGQKRRVAIARALLADADLLLLDEPFRGLDAAARAAACAAVLRRTAYIPCVLVTHDREEAEMLNAPVVRVPEELVT